MVKAKGVYFLFLIVELCGVDSKYKYENKRSYR